MERSGDWAKEEKACVACQNMTYRGPTAHLSCARPKLPGERWLEDKINEQNKCVGVG